MRHGDVEHGAGPTLSHNDDVLNISIRNDVHLAFQISQDGCPQSHPFNDARKIADFHNITDAELVFKQNEKAGYHILDEALGSESDGQAYNTGTGEHRTDVESKFRADRQYDN